MIGIKFFVDDQIVEAISEPYSRPFVASNFGLDTVDYETRVMVKWLLDNKVSEIDVCYLKSIPTEDQYQTWSKS